MSLIIYDLASGTPGFHQRVCENSTPWFVDTAGLEYITIAEDRDGSVKSHQPGVPHAVAIISPRIVPRPSRRVRHETRNLFIARIIDLLPGHFPAVEMAHAASIISSWSAQKGMGGRCESDSRLLAQMRDWEIRDSRPGARMTKDLSCIDWQIRRGARMTKIALRIEGGCGLKSRMYPTLHAHTSESRTACIESAAAELRAVGDSEADHSIVDEAQCLRPGDAGTRWSRIARRVEGTGRDEFGPGTNDLKAPISARRGGEVEKCGGRLKAGTGRASFKA
ncbi:hypothetical protein DFH09DRAFT_1087036 [Mycena vulgaris]|nr:hypothetical protein DFH09DRAFT_1087036 [Mycena vulgaris]